MYLLIINQHYGTIEEAEKAVAALNNKEFHGKRLRVEVID